MNRDPDRHHRHSVRLKGHDYAQHGAYFVTVCTRDRECFLGDVVDGEMVLNPLGIAVREYVLNNPANWTTDDNYHP